MKINKETIFNALLKFLIFQLVVFSFSNLFIIAVNTYQDLFLKSRMEPEKFINLKVMLIPLMISISITLLFYYLSGIRTKVSLLKKIDIKLFFLLVIPFVLSVIIILAGSVYNELAGINHKLTEFNQYTIVLLLIFIAIIIILIYTLILIIRNKALIISRIGLKLIFMLGLAFIISMLILNSLRKFVESYLLGYGDINPKTFVTLYNSISLGFIAVVIVTFILIILFSVNKWVEYLNYMTLKLKKISEIQFIDELDINGNDEFSDLANSINIMSKRLKNNYEREKVIEKEKNDLIVSVSHDIRTPLTSIIGYLELLNSDRLKSEDEIKRFTGIAYEKSKSLEKLINELFEYTKIANDYVSVDKIEFNIAVLVNQILGEQSLFFKEKNIEIEFISENNEIYCEIDIKKMVRIIENIVKNAQKYSYPNTYFKVTVSEDINQVLLTFENIGDNISKEELDLIFEKMYRQDKSRNSENEGSGLGLAIAKKLVEMHKGKLWAECENNIIKFSLLLPKK